MNRPVALVASLLLVVSAVAVPVAGSGPGVTGVVDADGGARTPLATPNASSAPGAHFAGVVGVQEAEVAGEMQGRTFEIRVGRARSNATKAGILADEVDDLHRRMTTLRERKASLLDARQNGSISRGRFRAEMAALAAELGAVHRQVDRVDTTARALPTPLLASKGVDASAIETLRNDASELAGPEVAAIARSIAGPDVGAGLAGGNASHGLTHGGPRQGPLATPTDSDPSNPPGPTKPTNDLRNGTVASPPTPALPGETPGSG